MNQKMYLASAYHLFVNSGGDFQMYMEEIQGYMYVLIN